MPNELKGLYANKEETVRSNFEVITRAAGKKESWFVAFLHAGGSGIHLGRRQGAWGNVRLR